MTGAFQPGAVRTLRMAVARAVGSAAAAGKASGSKVRAARARVGLIGDMAGGSSGNVIQDL